MHPPDVLSKRLVINHYNPPPSSSRDDIVLGQPCPFGCSSLKVGVENQPGWVQACTQGLIALMIPSRLRKS